jgi:hypothetical protein
MDLAVEAGWLDLPIFTRLPILTTSTTDRLPHSMFTKATYTLWAANYAAWVSKEGLTMNVEAYPH